MGLCAAARYAAVGWRLSDKDLENGGVSMGDSVWDFHFAPSPSTVVMKRCLRMMEMDGFDGDGNESGGLFWIEREDEIE